MWKINFHWASLVVLAAARADDPALILPNVTTSWQWNEGIKTNEMFNYNCTPEKNTSIVWQLSAEIHWSEGLEVAKEFSFDGQQGVNLWGNYDWLMEFLQ